MTYVHEVPGRLRLRHRGLAHETRDIRALCQRLRALPGVDDVAHRPQARSLVILYDPLHLDREALWSLLEGVTPPPTAAAGLPACKPPRKAPAGLDAGFMKGSAQGMAIAVGAAFGRALFSAVLKSSLERGVASLVTAAIR